MEGMDRAKLTLEATGDTMRGHGPRPPSGRFRLDMKKHYFPWRRNTLGTGPQEGVGSPLLEVSGLGWAKPQLP